MGITTMAGRGGIMLALAAGLSACSRGDVPLAGAIATQDAICRPELIVDGKSYDAGTAFVNGARPLLVTAHHLFGEMGGLPEEVRWQDMLHRATVIGHEQGAMLYAFDDPRIELQATSGAPVVDAGGKLVGINLGGTTAEGSPDVVGVGGGLEVVRKALATARGG
jgi:hypothetical protein